ncbi:MAG TPA: hypothetical protein VM123_13400 [archaeon]|nr:hypothetical protein [archaeon]
MAEGSEGIEKHPEIFLAGKKVSGCLCVSSAPYCLLSFNIVISLSLINY